MCLDPRRALIAAPRLRGHPARVARQLHPTDRALDTLTPKRAAAARRDGPSETAATTRSRRSTDSAFRHACRPPPPARSLNQIGHALGIPPDSTSSENALVAHQRSAIRRLWHEVADSRGEPRSQCGSSFSTDRVLTFWDRRSRSTVDTDHPPKRLWNSRPAVITNRPNRD
jgi:hypothetical protein